MRFFAVQSRRPPQWFLDYCATLTPEHVGVIHWFIIATITSGDERGTVAGFSLAEQQIIAEYLDVCIANVTDERERENLKISRAMIGDIPIRSANA